MVNYGWADLKDQWRGVLGQTNAITGTPLLIAMVQRESRRLIDKALPSSCKASSSVNMRDELVEHISKTGAGTCVRDLDSCNSGATT